jgi:hypothetical protein
MKKEKPPGYDAALVSCCFTKLVVPHGTLPEAAAAHYKTCPKHLARAATSAHSPVKG